MVHRLPEKARAGNGADPYLPGQRLAECQVAVEAELGDIQQDVIGSLRVGVSQMQIVQTG